MRVLAGWGEAQPRAASFQISPPPASPRMGPGQRVRQRLPSLGAGVGGGRGRTLMRPSWAQGGPAEGPGKAGAAEHRRWTRWGRGQDKEAKEDLEPSGESQPSRYSGNESRQDEGRGSPGG